MRSAMVVDVPELPKISVGRLDEQWGHDLAMAWDASRRAPPRRASLTYNRWLVEEGVAGEGAYVEFDTVMEVAGEDRPLPNCDTTKRPRVQASNSKVFSGLDSNEDKSHLSAGPVIGPATNNETLMMERSGFRDYFDGAMSQIYSSKLTSFVGSNGSSGGISLGWKNYGSVSLRSFSAHHIDIMINQDGLKHGLFGLAFLG
ncbi:hypothetical protein V6N12_057469 [Hibiscus sabdariffa]|uniref:Uncharacterized protein n=1 Tax=Hibiscus sabdariffa TaxID=183260 RepID=A0ABR2C580_9ROSI